MMEPTSTSHREEGTALSPLQLQYQRVCERQQQALVRNQALLHHVQSLQHCMSNDGVDMERLDALKLQYTESVAKVYTQWLAEVKAQHDMQGLREEGVGPVGTPTSTVPLPSSAVPSAARHKLAPHLSPHVDNGRHTTLDQLPHTPGRQAPSMPVVPLQHANVLPTFPTSLPPTSISPSSDKSLTVIAMTSLQPDPLTSTVNCVPLATALTGTQPSPGHAPPSLGTPQARTPGHTPPSVSMSSFGHTPPSEATPPPDTQHPPKRITPPVPTGNAQGSIQTSLLSDTAPSGQYAAARHQSTNPSLPTSLPLSTGLVLASGGGREQLVFDVRKTSPPVSATEGTDPAQPSGRYSLDLVQRERPVSTDPVRLLDELSLSSASTSKDDSTSSLREVEAPPMTTPTSHRHGDQQATSSPTSEETVDKQTPPTTSDATPHSALWGSSTVAAFKPPSKVETASIDSVRVGRTGEEQADDGGVRETGESERRDEHGNNKEERVRNKMEGEERDVVKRKESESNLSSESEDTSSELPLEDEDGKPSAYQFLAQSMQEGDGVSTHSSLLSEGSAVAQLQRDLCTSTPTPSPRVEEGEMGASVVSSKSLKSITSAPQRSPLQLPSVSVGHSPDTSTASDSLPFSPAYVPTAMQQTSQPSQPRTQSDLHRRLGFLMDSDTEPSEGDLPLTTSANQDDDKEDFDFYG